jgi:CMP-N-acetylneuraminic acid synthetase
LVVALLCGRKGSKGVPNKNIYPILGRPLMWYPLNAALHSKYIERIYISTDSEEITESGKRYNCSIIPRPFELATDEALLEDVLQHGYRHIVKDIGMSPELIVVLLCNAATVTTANIDKGIEMLRESEDADSVATVTLLNQYSPIRAKRIENGRLVPSIDLAQFGDKITCDRKCIGDTYFCDASLWILKPRCMDYHNGQLPFRWMGQNIFPIVQKGGLDVDDEDGLYATEKWLLLHGFTETKTPYDEQK